MIYVSVQNSESIDQALKRFNLKIAQSGLLRELKDHAHYEKPSEKRRKAARKRPQRS
ncbi:30S ribosomal protein S21 [bacterium]|jgi:small subunit ribosomal protein S21|nr:30S ribosomal protein S21 [Armatimonadetes bacterium Uphvl-Ar1]MBA4292194.1 30S ribosomal protein S21 [bacterium]